MEAPDTKTNTSNNRNGNCKWQEIIFTMHSLLFRVLWFHLDCALLHRVSWLFFNFCHIPVISALFVFCGCIAETISRLLWQIQNSFQTEVQNSSVTRHSSRQKKDKHLGGNGREKKREIICLVCVLLTCVFPCPPQITTVSGNEFLLQSDIDFLILDWFHAIKNAIDRLVCICFGCYLY